MAPGTLGSSWSRWLTSSAKAATRFFCPTLAGNRPGDSRATTGLNDADEATAMAAYAKLNPHPYKTFTDKITLKTELAAREVGKSYLNFQQDAALPHSLPWHPRLSEKLGLFRLVEGQGSHEVCFTNPALLAQKIIEAGRD